MQSYTDMFKKTLTQFLIITIIFILVGSLFSFWGLWVLYLIPSVILFTKSQEDDHVIAKIYHSFFIVTAFYVGLGATVNIWHPTWLIYLIPVILFLQKK